MRKETLLPKLVIQALITPYIYDCEVVVKRVRFGADLLSGEPDYFGRNEISSGGDLSHYSSASLY